MSANCPTILLDDLPTGSDAFGSHERLAKAIAALVTQEKGAKAISLTGPWGSGKSTVVRLLGTILSRSCPESPDTALFVYDAWAHQEDPLRRSFLERLVRFLEERGWTTKGEWQAELDQLSRRREESEITTEPILTGWGTAVLVALGLVPVGGGLIALGADLWRWAPWIGLALVSVPLLVAILGLISKRESLSALLIQKIREVQRATTIRTPEPTSIEFQRLFTRIVRHALANENRRLVVVMDNLDRVAPEDALKAWSTMRTFFDGQTSLAGAAERKWLENFWLLVPFDRTALGRIWAQRSARLGPENRKTEDQADDLTLEGKQETSTGDERDRYQEDETAIAFFDKSFQIEFRVPTPVLSRWKEFFLEQFAKAFPRHADKADGEKAYRLFRRVGLPMGRPLGPRDIKLFINRLGAVHRQWSDEIPLAIQALYVLYADRIRKAEQDLLTEDFLEPAVEALIEEEDWRKYLAALHYNVAVSEAYQALIGPRVEECLRNGDAGGFSGLVHIPAVATVCDHVLEENWKDWAASEPSALAHSALVLDEVGGRGSAWTACWSWLAKGLELVEEWNGLDERTGKGITVVLSRLHAGSREETARRITRAIRKDGNLAGTGDKVPPEEAISNWVDGAVEVVRYLDQSGFGDLVRDEFRVPGTAGAYIVALRGLGDRHVDVALLRYFVPEIETEGVVEELARISVAGELSEAHIGAVHVMLRVGAQWPWHALCEAINQRLQATNTLTQEELVGALKTLLTLKKEDIQQAKETLDFLCRQGHLMHHLHEVRQHPKIAALPILAYLIAFPDGPIQAAPGNANAGKQFYEKLLQNPMTSPKVVTALAELCVELQMAEAAVVAYKTTGRLQQLAAAILGAMANREDVAQQLRSDYLIAEWDTISSLLDDEQLEVLLKALVERGELVERLVSEPPELGDGSLYCLAYDKANPNQRRRLASVLMPMLRAVEKDKWLGELDAMGYLLDLVLMLVKDENMLDLDAKFHDALLDRAREMINSSEAAPEHLAANWHRLPQALDEDRRQTLAKNLWDELANNASNRSLVTFHNLYGQYLLGTSPSNPDEAIRRVCSPIMNRSERDEIAWVADLLERQRSCWEKADAATKRDFRDRVKAKLSECDDDALRPIVERIARAIGLSPEKIMEDSENGGQPRRNEEE